MERGMFAMIMTAIIIMSFGIIADRFKHIYYIMAVCTICVILTWAAILNLDWILCILADSEFFARK